jgi:hypothetical protein
LQSTFMTALWRCVMTPRRSFTQVKACQG